MSEDRMDVSAEEALGVVKQGDEVHTFLNGSGVLLGADWARADVEEGIRAAGVRTLTGPMARGMGHGLAFFREGDRTGWVYVATDEAALAALEASRRTAEATP
jgi:hypothetical protein